MKKGLIILIAAITACSQPKYYQSTGTISIKNGKVSFIQKSMKTPLKDTVINNVILISKNK